MTTCAYVRRNGPRRSLTYGVPPAATPAPVLRSMPAQAFSSSTRRTIPGSATSASRISRASCKSFAGILASRQPGNFSISEKLGLPALAISPRSCAASYSSARRRLAPAKISVASACVRCAAAKQNPRRYRRQGQHVYGERRAVLHSVAPQGPCLTKETRGRTNCPAYIVGAACPLCPGQARASRSAPWRRCRGSAIYSMGRELGIQTKVGVDLHDTGLVKACARTCGAIAGNFPPAGRGPGDRFSNS